MDIFTSLQPYLILCSMKHLSHWLVSGNFHECDIGDSKVWEWQRVWCNAFVVICINVEFLFCFGKNSRRSLSYDVKLKLHCSLITLYHWRLFSELICFFSNRSCSEWVVNFKGYQDASRHGPGMLLSLEVLPLVLKTVKRFLLKRIISALVVEILFILNNLII